VNELTGAFFTRLDSPGNPTPELVTEIPTQQNGGISKDVRRSPGIYATAVKWSDGRPFDSSDVTLHVARDARPRRNNIAVRDTWERLESITAPDKYTVVFRLKAPYSTFIADYFNIQSAGGILPRHQIGPGTNFNQSPYNALPVGIGPFRYTAFNRGNDVEMRRTRTTFAACRRCTKSSTNDFRRQHPS